MGGRTRFAGNCEGGYRVLSFGAGIGQSSANCPDIGCLFAPCRFPLLRFVTCGTPPSDGGIFLSGVSPCFTPGTLIATAQGWQPVETLRQGHRIVTRDNGLRRISWIGRRDIPYEDLVDEPGLQPIMVKRGSLGPGQPARDMLVSPNHRFLIKTPLRGGEEVLMAARHLVDRRGIFPASVLGVSYLHVLADAHEVILANGAWTESFHPDDAVLRLMARRQRQELLKLFPDVETQGAATRFPSARDIRSSKFDG